VATIAAGTIQTTVPWWPRTRGRLLASPLGQARHALFLVEVVGVTWVIGRARYPGDAGEAAALAGLLLQVLGIGAAFWALRNALHSTGHPGLRALAGAWLRRVLRRKGFVVEATASAFGHSDG
jgi:hypothetical protein